MLDVLKELTGQRTVPNVFVNGQHIGGCDQTVQAYSNGTLAQLILEGQGARDVQKAGDHAYQYDLIVIGGGSGGLACSKVLFAMSYCTFCVLTHAFLLMSPMHWCLLGEFPFSIV